MKKVMKKALSCFLAVAMIFSILTPAYAAEPEVPTITMTADTTKIEAGETVSFEIAIDKSYSRLNDYQFNLYFDPDLFELTATEKGPACTNTDFGVPQMDYTDYYPGETYVNVLAIDFDGLPVVLNAGVICTFTFTAKEDVAGEGLFKLVPVSITDYDDFYNVAEELDENHVTVMVGTPGVAMPEGAPFTAITTDAGDVIAVEQQEDVYGVPYYIVTIPEGAETAYVTAPDQVVMEDWNTGEMQATAYAYEIENGWNQLFISYNYEESEDGPIVEIPMYMVASDWSGEVELCFVENEDGDLTHTFGIEDANYACQGMISFRYGEAESDGAESYAITLEQAEGGTIAVYDVNFNEITKAAAGEYVLVDAIAADGYRFTNYVLVNGEAVFLENGFFKMPAEDVTVAPVFEVLHTCVSDQQVAAENYLKSVATCQSGAVYYMSCTCGLTDTNIAETFVYGDTTHCVYVDGVCQWCSDAEAVTAPGYRYAASADATAEFGGNAIVSVKITGHSDPSINKYNAYDLTLTFDSEKLEFVGYEGAVKSDNGSVTVNGNEIRIVGCGEDKYFDTQIASLIFKTKAEGAANVNITQVRVSDRETAVDENIPAASAKHEENDSTVDSTPEQSVILVPYTVTKPDFVFGGDQVLHGEDYTFSFTDTDHYTYTDLKVTVGGVAVEVAEDNGDYTIENVTGAVEITVTRTPNSYTVNKPENVTGLDQATYGEDYIFTVTPAEGMTIESVTVTDQDGNVIPYTVNENGEYVIAGTDITGEFTITVVEKSDMTTVIFAGVEESEVQGGLTQTAKIGKAFSFVLNKAEGFTYIVKVGETELTEKNGSYTIPAELMVEGGVLVIIEKVDNTKATVDVTEYINLDGKVMFLVTAKWGDKVLAYGEGNTMFWSDRYTVAGEETSGAYCWLVLSDEEMNTIDQVKAAAEIAIVEAAADAEAIVVKYNYDVNATTKVDVNDAQLAYDMYNASYMDFTEDLPMRKFLEADMETDSKLDTKDVAAIINYIVKGANA